MNSGVKSAAFLLSDLEPGASGVGDYATMLCEALDNEGVATKLISIRDQSPEYLEEPTGNKVRIPSAWSDAKRRQKLEEIFNAFKPDWVSLQYSAYGVSTNGMAAEIKHWLPHLPATTHRHIMFHETWVGASPQAPLKHRVIGWFQRRSLQQFLAWFTPSCVHSHASVYRALIERKLGINCNFLPLFSNLPINKETISDDRDSLINHRLGLASDRRRSEWVVGIFGSIFPEWNPAEVLSRLIKLGKEHAREIHLVGIGRHGAGAVEALKVIQEDFSESMKFTELGPVSPSEASQLIAGLDYSIAMTPLEVFGKSSSARTVREHGIPLIVPRAETPLWKRLGVTEPDDALIIPLDDRFEKGVIETRREIPRWTRTDVARRLIGDLSESV
ncbi:MAG: glycosyltransferase [Verrucomicrobiota bacterium]